jgi:hypothetical protein
MYSLKVSFLNRSNIHISNLKCEEMKNFERLSYEDNNDFDRI